MSEELNEKPGGSSLYVVTGGTDDDAYTTDGLEKAKEEAERQRSCATETAADLIGVDKWTCGFDSEGKPYSDGERVWPGRKVGEHRSGGG